MGLANKETQPQDSSAIAQPLNPLQLPLDEMTQETLAEIVLDDYEKAKRDRSDRDYGTNSKGETLTFDKWMESIKNIYNGYRVPKTIPWRFCSNRSLRIAMAILEMLHARIYSAIYNDDLTRWRAGGKEDNPKKERIEKFMSWWNRVWSPINVYIDKWSKVAIAYGDALTEGTWEVEEFMTSDTQDQPIVDEMGQPLVNQDGTPAVQKIPKINREERTNLILHDKEKVLFLKGAKDIQKDPVMIEETYLYKDLQAMAKKGTVINLDKIEKYLIVNVPDKTGDEEKNKRLKQIKLRNLPVKVVRWYGHYDYQGVGFEESIRVMVCPEYRIYLGGVRVSDITKSGKRPLEFAKYADKLECPDDLFGEGVLDNIRELAEEIDACFNQMTDGNTLSILRPGFYDPSGDLDADAIEMAPNKLIPVTDPSRNVYFPPVDINTDRLINAIRLVMEFVERLTAASSYVMGKESEIVGGSGTATRTQAIVQSAEIRFALPAERLKASAGRIITMVLDLIQKNIPEGFEQRVLGEKGQPLFLQGELSDIGLSGKFDCYIAADPTMGSKQTERELAQVLYSLFLQNPIVMTDPTKIYAFSADVLKANGKDPEDYLGPAPSPDDIDQPEDENTLMLQGDFQRVRAQLTENHFYHIQKHMEFMQSPSMAALQQQHPDLVNQVAQYAQQHIMEHQMMMMQMQKMLQMGQSQQGGQGGAGNENPDKGNDKNTSVDNTEGPLGEALNSQRQGEVQQASQPPMQG